MKISELIKKLEELKEKHGDLGVRSLNWKDIDTVEYREKRAFGRMMKFIQVV